MHIDTQVSYDLISKIQDAILSMGLFEKQNNFYVTKIQFAYKCGMQCIEPT